MIKLVRTSSISHERLGYVLSTNIQYGPTGRAVWGIGVYHLKAEIMGLNPT
jgi:hypothetical protein